MNSPKKIHVNYSEHWWYNFWWKNETSFMSVNSIFLAHSVLVLGTPASITRMHRDLCGHQPTPHHQWIPYPYAMADLQYEFWISAKTIIYFGKKLVRNWPLRMIASNLPIIFQCHSWVHVPNTIVLFRVLNDLEDLDTSLNRPTIQCAYTIPVAYQCRPFELYWIPIRQCPVLQHWSNVAGTMLPVPRIVRHRPWWLGHRATEITKSSIYNSFSEGSPFPRWPQLTV